MSQTSSREEHDRWCITCAGPNFAFADASLTCRRCGVDFVFTAGQQRYWFMDLGLVQAAKPPRLCPSCGRTRRTARRLQNDLAAAVHATRQHPDDVDALLRLASAVAAHVAHTGRGNAAQGVAAARRAAQMDPTNHAARYWEGVCHDAAGRPRRALACYERFVAEAPPNKQLRRLIGRAGNRIGQLRRTPPDSTTET